MILDKSLEYFTTFSEKDSAGLRNMFSNDVYLRDWEILANGIDEVYIHPNMGDGGTAWGSALLEWKSQLSSVGKKLYPQKVQ